MTEQLAPRRFTDSEGRTWLLEINAWTIKRVRLMTGVELGKFTGKDAINKLCDLIAGDVEKFVDVLYVLCEDQCAKLGITDEQFGRSLRGDSIDQAGTAFYGAFADFCRGQGRTVLLTLLEKAEIYSKKVTTLALEKIAAVDVEMLTTTSSSAKSSPQSAESTPTPVG